MVKPRGARAARQPGCAVVAAGAVPRVGSGAEQPLSPLPGEGSKLHLVSLPGCGSPASCRAAACPCLTSSSPSLASSCPSSSSSSSSLGFLLPPPPSSTGWGSSGGPQVLNACGAPAGTWCSSSHPLAPCFGVPPLKQAGNVPRRGGSPSPPTSPTYIWGRSWIRPPAWLLPVPPAPPCPSAFLPVPTGCWWGWVPPRSPRTIGVAGAAPACCTGAGLFLAP